MSDELSPFVSSMTIRIDRRAAEYAKEVDEVFDLPLNAHEQPLLDAFNVHVESVVVAYDPPGIRRRGDSLVFAHVYAAARGSRVPVDETRRVPTELLAALLAAEVEFRGPLRLSRTQNALLAQVYERLGKSLLSVDLPAHAELAFSRAAGLHRLNEDVDDEDRCALAEVRARRRAMPHRSQRLLDGFADLMCGYGYRPFRLLGWMAVELVVFIGIAAGITGQPVLATSYLCLTNFLNPLGVGDTAQEWQSARVVFVVEAYAGTVSMSVFFALLVRRWFRL